MFYNRDIHQLLFNSDLKLTFLQYLILRLCQQLFKDWHL
nr:MAG TPA: hypothetical protein [Caudoviricetes sp.]